MSGCKTFLLLVSLIIGYKGQKPGSLVHKVNILEQQINLESNQRSHETAIIFQRLDEIDQHVNRSLEMYEEMCHAETGNENDKRLSGDEKGDLANDLTNSDTLRTVRNDIIKLYRAFGKEKHLHTEMRDAFPNLKKEVDHYLKLTSALENESKIMTSNYLNLKAENIKQDTVIKQLKRENRDLQNSVEMLTEDIRNTENESDRYAKEIQQLKHNNRDLQNAIELMTAEIKNIKDDIDNFSIDILQLKNHTKDFKQHLFSSCANALDKGYKQSGIYHVTPGSTLETLKVYCDQVTAGGGWIVFQRRMDGLEDFYRGWEDYKTGFGSLQAEFWLGNENLNAFTAAGEHELRIDMEDFEGNKAYAQYRNFKISEESQKYKLEVSGYHGNASDSLEIHNAKKFSTWDNDNDSFISGNCAKDYTGAWWYSHCLDSNLNGKYYKSGKCPIGKGILWYHLKNSGTYSLKFTEMKFR